MAKTVLGVFTDRVDAEEAIGRLEMEGFSPSDISIVMKDTSEGREIAENTGADVASGTLSGATTGAALGGLAGLLAATVIPGLGAIFIGGPVAAALGLTGAAATTISGATTGAVAGGLIGALTSFGLSEDDARVYEEHINRGAILLAVPTSEIHEDDVQDIMSECGADEIRTVSNEQHRRVRPTESDDFSYSYGAKGGRSRTNDTDLDDDL